ncbi:hypothetical protein ACHAPX_004689 [Trichoderma viride]
MRPYGFGMNDANSDEHGVFVTPPAGWDNSVGGTSFGRNLYDVNQWVAITGAELDAWHGAVPLVDAPAGDAPAGDAPAGDAPAGDAPVAYNMKPVELVASDVSQHIRAESNSRLRDAVRKGVPLDALYFSDDFYPAWDSIYEMNPGHNHHAQVQTRLLNREAAALVDRLIMKELVASANEKLEEARLLGVALTDISIGADLVPEWHRRAVDVEAPLPEHVMDHWEDSLQRNVDTFGVDFVMDNIIETASEDDSIAALDTTSDREEPVTHDSDSSASDDGTGHGNNQHEESIDDRYAMFSGGDPQPLPFGYKTIAESDDEAPHILHDVEIHDGSNGIYHVDMEV